MLYCQDLHCLFVRIYIVFLRIYIVFLRIYIVFVRIYVVFVIYCRMKVLKSKKSYERTIMTIFLFVLDKKYFRM